LACRWVLVIKDLKINLYKILKNMGARWVLALWTIVGFRVGLAPDTAQEAQ